MIITVRHLAFVGLFILSLACLHHRPTDDVQQVSLVPRIDTIGKDLDARQAQRFIQASPNVIVLDVRTPEEYMKGHIDKAKNVNLYDPEFITKLAALDRSKPYVVHCAVGGRSRKAAAVMDSLGFRYVYQLKGGITGWQQAGQPIVKQK